MTGAPYCSTCRSSREYLRALLMRVPSAASVEEMAARLSTLHSARRTKEAATRSARNAAKAAQKKNGEAEAHRSAAVSYGTEDTRTQVDRAET